MSFFAEIRHRLNYLLGPVFGVFVFTYFVYHVFHGERGLYAWWQISNRIESVTFTLNKIREDRKRLEHRTHLLHPENLDPDILEERARVMLNYGNANDIIIIDSKGIGAFNE